MGNGEAPPGFPVDQVPMLMVPVPQQFTVVKGEMNGTPVVLCRFMSPLTTTVVILEHAAARKLADDLRAETGGLSVVDDPGTVQRLIRPGDTST